MRSFLLSTFAAVTFAAVSLGSVTQAHAVPTLKVEIYNGATLIGSASSTTGLLNYHVADSTFDVTFGGSGAPFLPMPDLSSSTFDAKQSGTGGTLTIKFTEIDLTIASAGQLANTFAANTLNAGNQFNGISIANYYDASNTAFGTGTLLASANYTGKGSFQTGPVNANLPADNLFSESMIFTISFANGAQGTVSGSSQLNAVPEPASILMIGAGLAGLGGAIRRRRATSAAA